MDTLDFCTLCNVCIARTETQLVTQGSPGQQADADAEGQGTLSVKRGLLPARRPNLILRESLGGKPALMPSRSTPLPIHHHSSGSHQYPQPGPVRPRDALGLAAASSRPPRRAVRDSEPGLRVRNVRLSVRVFEIKLAVDRNCVTPYS